MAKQYCYKLITDLEEINLNTLETKLQRIYLKKKFGDLAYETAEDLPFVTIFDNKNNEVCIKMISTAKKHINRIEGIHSKLKAADLKISPELKLEKPYEFKLEQVKWYDGEEDCVIEDDDIKWTTLEHNGPYFGHLEQPYEPHGEPIIYDGVEYVLTPKEEEVANFYAARMLSEQDGGVTDEWTKDPKFNANYWNDFKTYLTPQHKKIFKTFSKFDFSPIVEYYRVKKEAKKSETKADKKAKKALTEQIRQKHGYATINGNVEKVGNYTVEPAAIFYGRGEQPKRGKIKPHVYPEDVTINIGKGVPVPKAPGGHKWGSVIHDRKNAWLAAWKDSITGKNKYVYFAASGQIKGKSDLLKYEKARKLDKYIDKIRASYTKDINSKDPKLRQLGTVIYLIDNYGIRVGGKKDEDKADTVGASTLRVEHVKFKEPDTIIFDFLGKDSIQYYKEIKVDKNIYRNFKQFVKGKKPSEDLFDLVTASTINSYLQTFDKDISAKVFRTRLASTIMDAALKNAKLKKKPTLAELKNAFMVANVEVAKLLNHKRTITKKAQETVQKYEKELRQLKKDLKAAKEAGKSTKTLENRIAKKKEMINNKKLNLNVAATTSLQNYIDPRLVVSWSAKHDFPLPYTKAMKEKFTWASDTTDADWDYSETELLPAMAKLQPSSGLPAKACPKKKKVGPKKTTTKKKPATKKPAVKKDYNKSFIATPLKGIQIVDYSDKSYLVIGNTKPIKDWLKEAGGRFSKGFVIDDVKIPGWVFSKAKIDVDQLLAVIEGDKPEAEPPVETVKETPKPGKVKVIMSGNGIAVVDYTEKSVAVVGKTKDIKDQLKEINAKFNKNLKIGNKTIIGWVLSKKRIPELQELLSDLTGTEVTVKSTPTPTAPSKPKYPQKKLTSPVKNIDIIDYSQLNVAVVGNISKIIDQLIDIGGKQEELKVFGKKMVGVKISKKKLDEVTEIVADSLNPTWQEVMDTYKLTEKERKIINCFASSPNVVDYIADALSADNSQDVYTPELLEKYLSCLEEENDFDDIEYVELVDKVVETLEPNSIPTYIFLVMVLQKTVKDKRDEYLESLVKQLENTDELQKCL